MASANSYLVGNLVNITAIFTDGTGTLVDPDTVVLEVLTPASVLVQPTVVRDSVGAYHAAYSLIGLSAGTYRYRWTSTGGAQAAAEGSFKVTKSAVLS